MLVFIAFKLKVFEAFSSHLLVEVAVSIVKVVFTGVGFGSASRGRIEYIIGVVVLPKFAVAENVVGLLYLSELEMPCGIEIGVQFFC